MEEAATTAATTDIPVSAEEPPSELEASQLAVAVSDAVGDGEVDTVIRPTVDGAVEGGGESPPSYAEIVGETEGSSPDAHAAVDSEADPVSEAVEEPMATTVVQEKLELPTSEEPASETGALSAQQRRRVAEVDDFLFRISTPRLFN